MKLLSLLILGFGLLKGLLAGFPLGLVGSLFSALLGLSLIGLALLFELLGCRFLLAFECILHFFGLASRVLCDLLLEEGLGTSCILCFLGCLILLGLLQCLVIGLDQILDLFEVRVALLTLADMMSGLSLQTLGELREGRLLHLLANGAFTGCHRVHLFSGIHIETINSFEGLFVWLGCLFLASGLRGGCFSHSLISLCLYFSFL